MPTLETVLWLALCGALGLLIAVLSWIGARVHSKLDDLAARMESKLEDIYATLSSIEHDLRGDLAGLDRRVTTLEARCESCVANARGKQ